MSRFWGSCAATTKKRVRVEHRAQDIAHMKSALALARRHLGNTGENPSVGCVIVDTAGNVSGRGSTARGGRPHAETLALAQAGPAAKGGSAYVTLEPCAHRGATPPCVDALITAGVSRVVIGTKDPDPRTAGKSISKLEGSGIEVVSDTCRADAQEAILGFTSRIKRGRPAVTLKMATSLDGKIATHSGHSQWITGEAARKAAHLLRSEHDAIMVGSGTAVEDNPDLTCRIEGLEDRSPVRIVADGRLRLPLTSNLVTSAVDHPTWVITAKAENKPRQKALKDAGVEIIEVGRNPTGELDLSEALNVLGARGLNRVLVEGGSHLAASLLRTHLVDRVIWYRAPLVIGGDGRPAFEAMAVGQLNDAVGLKRISLETIGKDVTETYEIHGVTDALFGVD